jgi:hypothetical protein
VEGIGTGLAKESVDVTANATELVVGLHFEDGQTVEKGKLLVQLRDDQYQAELRQKTAQNTITQKDRDIAGIKKTVSAKDQQLAKEKAAFGKLKDRNDTLLQLLEKEGIPRDTKLWTDGSKEAKRALQGKIIEIDNHFGFMVIDIGSATKVGQKVGPKIAYFNPKIADDAEFLVVRDFDNENSKYIGRIKLFKLSENNAYAKWVTPPVAGEKVKIGDFVFLPDDTIEATSATKK